MSHAIQILLQLCIWTGIDDWSSIVSGKFSTGPKNNLFIVYTAVDSPLDPAWNSNQFWPYPGLTNVT